MLLQYMHKCSRRKTQDTFILPLATAPSLFLSFTIFWKELSSQNFISTSSLHLLPLPPQSTETHQTPTTPHPLTQISVLISLWCLTPLSTACSIPSSLEFLMIFLPYLWVLLRPSPALLPLPFALLLIALVPQSFVSAVVFLPRVSSTLLSAALIQNLCWLFSNVDFWQRFCSELQLHSWSCWLQTCLLDGLSHPVGEVGGPGKS